MSRISETPKGVLETYDWQDVAEDLQERINKALTLLIAFGGGQIIIKDVIDILKGDADV